MAIKSIYKDKISSRNGKESLLNEIRICRKLNLCSQVLQLSSVYESEKFIHLILDYQQGGCLTQRLKDQGVCMEQEVQTILKQLLLALDFIHKKGIIHRDIKLDNILLASRVGIDLRIADFGLSVMLEGQRKLKYKCGSPGYVAPEMLRD